MPNYGKFSPIYGTGSTDLTQLNDELRYLFNKVQGGIAEKELAPALQSYLGDTGINPDYIRWGRNLLANSEFTVRARGDAFSVLAHKPKFWDTDGYDWSFAVPWVGERSLVMRRGDSAVYNPGDVSGAVVNPYFLFQFGVRRLRFSAYALGDLTVGVYDATHDRLFTLRDGENSGANLSYGDHETFRRFSFSFDASEFGDDCTDIRVSMSIPGESELEETLINAPQLTADKTGSEPQAYVPGPYCAATADRSPLELMNFVSLHHRELETFYITDTEKSLLGEPIAFRVYSECDLSGAVSVVGSPSFALQWALAVRISGGPSGFSKLAYQTIVSQATGGYGGGFGDANIRIPFIMPQCNPGNYSLEVIGWVLTEGENILVTGNGTDFTVNVSSLSGQAG